MRTALVIAACLAAAPAWATDPTLLDRFGDEPTVRDLQREAARLAELSPERVRSWLRRAGNAAWMPTVRARVGRGLGQLVRDSSDRLLLTNTDTWSFDVQATWSLDRLVFDRNEVWASGEARRVAARREELLTRVAQLYYARRRLQVDAVLSAATSPAAATSIDRALEIDELTAVLDGLTDGALSRGKRGP